MDGVEGPLLALTFVLMFVGLLGSVLPGLPGVTLIFLSALVYALLTDFRTVGAAILVILFVFAAIAFVADFVATSYGARRFGASNWGTVGGAIGGIAGALIGLLLLGIGFLFGLILGTIAGVFLVNTSSARVRANKNLAPQDPTGTAPRTRQAASSSATWPPPSYRDCLDSPAS